MEILKKITYLGGLYSIGSLLERGIAFLFIPIYTTYLSTADYGIIGLMWVTVALCGRFFYPPIYQGFIRHYNSVEFHNKQGLLLFNSFLALMIQALLSGIIFFWFSKFIASTLLENEELNNIVQIYAFILFFQPLNDFLFAFLRQIEKAKLFVTISFFHSLLYAGFVLSGLIYFDLGVMAMVYGLLLGFIFKVFCILPIFWGKSTHKISLSVLSQPLKYGYQRLVDGWSSILIQFGDRYVLLFFYTVSTVGLYNFGYQIASIIGIIFVTPLINALEPIIFKQEKKPAEQKVFIKKSSTYFYLLGMFICLSLSLFSKEIIEMIAAKEEFWGSWVVVPVIAYSHLLAGMGILFDWGLVMTKSGFLITINVFIGTILNIGFNFLLIPAWGISGAAYATLISIVVMNGVRIYYSGKLYGLHFELSRLLHITIVSFLLFMLALFIGFTGSLAIDISLKFVILLSFPLAMFITGFFNFQEIEHITKFWNVVKENGFRATFAKIKSFS